MQRIAGYPRVEVRRDGTGVVSHVGTRLLADVAAAVGLPQAFDERGRRASAAPVGARAGSGADRSGGAAGRRRGDDHRSGGAAAPARPVRAGRLDATAWRVLDSVDDTVLAALKRARAEARERAWLLRAEAGRPVPTVRCGGVAVPGLVIDFDASLVTCHSEKEAAAATFKHGFGYHPLLVWLDNTNEALAGMLRPGNAGSNTAADHIRLTDEALGQIPDAAAARAADPGPQRRRRRHQGMADPPAPLPRRAGSGAAVLGRVHRHQPGQRRDRGAARDRCGRSRSTRPGSPARSTRPACRSPRSPS